MQYCFIADHFSNRDRFEHKEMFTDAELSMIEKAFSTRGQTLGKVVQNTLALLIVGELAKSGEKHCVTARFGKIYPEFVIECASKVKLIKISKRSLVALKKASHILKNKIEALTPILSFDDLEKESQALWDAIDIAYLWKSVEDDAMAVLRCKEKRIAGTAIPKHNDLDRQSVCLLCRSFLKMAWQNLLDFARAGDGVIEFEPNIPDDSFSDALVIYMENKAWPSLEYASAQGDNQYLLWKRPDLRAGRTLIDLKCSKAKNVKSVCDQLAKQIAFAQIFGIQKGLEKEFQPFWVNQACMINPRIGVCYSWDLDRNWGPSDLVGCMNWDCYLPIFNNNHTLFEISSIISLARSDLGCASFIAADVLYTCLSREPNAKNLSFRSIRDKLKKHMAKLDVHCDCLLSDNSQKLLYRILQILGRPVLQFYNRNYCPITRDGVLKLYIEMRCSPDKKRKTRIRENFGAIPSLRKNKSFRSLSLNDLMTFRPKT